MTKKLTVFMIACLMLISMNLMAEVKREGRDMMRHARFGLHMAEKNLFPAHMLLKFKDEIGLTQEQVSKIEKMQELFSEAIIRKQADIKIKELKTHSYLKKEQVDRKEMEKMIREVARMKTDMQIDHMNYLLDLRDLLTAEQMENIETLKKEKIHKLMERRKWREQRPERQRQPHQTEKVEKE